MPKNVELEIYKTGGAHSIAALLMEQNFKKVDKIVGPGNAWVLQQKKFLEK